MIGNLVQKGEYKSHRKALCSPAATTPCSDDCGQAEKCQYRLYSDHCLLLRFH